MYADDTTLYFNLEDFSAQNRSMLINNELERVNTWLKLNKLTLNVEKTKGMIFHKRCKIEHTKWSMYNRTIDIVSQFSFLGVILDEHLSWKEHVNMVTNKLSKISGVLNRLKYVFPKQILINLYKSLFTPHLNLLWGTNTKQIEILQKIILRIITNSTYIAQTEPILKELGLINIKDMFFLKIRKFLHNLSHNMLPPYFESYKQFLEKIAIPYFLRPHPLPLPPTSHVYAESGIIS